MSIFRNNQTHQTIAVRPSHASKKKGIVTSYALGFHETTPED